MTHAEAALMAERLVGADVQDLKFSTELQVRARLDAALDASQNRVQPPEEEEEGSFKMVMTVPVGPKDISQGSFRSVIRL